MATACVLADNGQSAAQEIEIQVSFLQVSETLPDKSGISQQLDDSKAQSLVGSNFMDVGSCLSTFANASRDLLSAPKIRTQSGSNATIKVVTECRYATNIVARCVSLTNGTDVVRGIVVEPGTFATRDVGVTLNVTPVWDAQRNMIDLTLMAEIVSEPTWTEYTASYEGMDGTRKTQTIAQPVFGTRRINQNLSLGNNATVIAGEMITREKKSVEDSVPVLGAIPWIGRLFRSDHEVCEKTTLLVFVSAKNVGKKP
jgi:type II secretory pathway component GspD/PulD (secretin)